MTFIGRYFIPLLIVIIDIVAVIHIVLLTAVASVTAVDFMTYYSRTITSLKNLPLPVSFTLEASVLLEQISTSCSHCIAVNNSSLG